MPTGTTLLYLQNAQIVGSTQRSAAVGQEILSETIRLRRQIEQSERSRRQLEIAAFKKLDSIDHELRRVNEHLSEIGDRLSRLAVIADNPEKVWAYEQYRIALDAAAKGLEHEALKFITAAIEGAASHTGYPLEPNFHMLKAQILAELVLREDLDVENAVAAADTFLRAADLLEISDIAMKEKATFMAASLYLASGEFDKATVCYARSIQMVPSFASRFEGLGKSYVALGDAEKSESSFFISLLIDWTRAGVYREAEEFASVRDPARRAERRVIELVSKETSDLFKDWRGRSEVLSAVVSKSHLTSRLLELPELLVSSGLSGTLEKIMETRAEYARNIYESAEVLQKEMPERFSADTESLRARHTIRKRPGFSFWKKKNQNDNRYADEYRALSESHNQAVKSIRSIASSSGAISRFGNIPLEPLRLKSLVESEVKKVI